MITMMVSAYEIRSVDAHGGEGPVIAMAQQQRMAFKEQVTVLRRVGADPASV
jgi:hypothetical protein